MAASNTPRPGSSAVVVAVLVTLSVAVLPGILVSGGATAGHESAHPDQFASATRTIEAQQLPPGGTTTVTVEVTIEEAAGMISINDGVKHADAANPSFERVDDLSVDFRGGSGTTEISRTQSSGVSVGVEDVPVGTIIVVTFDVTVTDDPGDSFGGRYNFRGSVQSNEHADSVEIGGDSEIRVNRTDEDDETASEGPTADPQRDDVTDTERTVSGTEHDDSTTSSSTSGEGGDIPIVPIAAGIGLLVALGMGLAGVWHVGFRPTSGGNGSGTADGGEHGRSTRTHEVDEGDTDWDISEEEYGDPVEWDRIEDEDGIDDLQDLEDEDESDSTDD